MEDMGRRVEGEGRKERERRSGGGVDVGYISIPSSLITTPSLVFFLPHQLSHNIIIHPPLLTRRPSACGFGILGEWEGFLGVRG